MQPIKWHAFCILLCAGSDYKRVEQVKTLASSFEVYGEFGVLVEGIFKRMNTADPRDRFHSLVVDRVVPETKDCCSIELSVPEASRELFRPQPGQFLTIRATIDGRVRLRCYSASNLAEFGEPLRITIKRVEGGTVSSWLNDTLRTGHALEVAPPAGRFLLRASETQAIFLAAGSGITPILPMMRFALEVQGRSIALLYWNRSPGEAIFVSALRDLARRFPETFEYNELYGRRSDPHLSANLSAFAARHCGADGYLCGPAGFMALAKSHLMREQYSEDKLIEENFGNGSEHKLPPSTALLATTTIVVHRDGSRREVLCRGNQILLESLLASGLLAPHSCKEGHCGACVVRLVNGGVETLPSSALSRRDRQKGLILACRSRPAASEIELSYDF